MSRSPTEIQAFVVGLRTAGMGPAADILEDVARERDKLLKKIQAERRAHERVFKIGKLPTPVPTIYMDAPAPSSKKQRVARKPIGDIDATEE